MGGLTWCQLPKGTSSTDLPRIGEGRATVFLTRDPNCLGGVEVLELLNSIRADYEGRVVFKFRASGDKQCVALRPPGGHAARVMKRVKLAAPPRGCRSDRGDGVTGWRSVFRFEGSRARSGPVSVYVSSTYLDLVAHRAALKVELERAGYDVESMERYAAFPEPPLDRCLADVAACGCHVLILSHRYGYVPPQVGDLGLSITEMEYDEAVRTKKPSFVFCVGDGWPWPPEFVDVPESESAQRLQRLKQQVQVAHGIRTFTTPDDLTKQVLAALSSYYAPWRLRRFGRTGLVVAALGGMMLAGAALLFASGARTPMDLTRLGADLIAADPSTRLRAIASLEAGAPDTMAQAAVDLLVGHIHRIGTLGRETAAREELHTAMKALSALLAQADQRRQAIRRPVLDGIDLSSQDLKAFHFAGVTFQNGSLENADLHGADLTESQFVHMNLGQAVAPGASLKMAVFDNSCLAGTILSGGANLEKSLWMYSDFSAADLRGANLRGVVAVGTHLERVAFEKADLTHADLAGATGVEATQFDAILESPGLRRPPRPVSQSTQACRPQADR